MSSNPRDNHKATNPALEIGARLATHRTRRGMRVSALAREVGVSPSLISQIERGQSRPSVSTLFSLAEALQVPVDAFFRDPKPRPADEAGGGRRADDDVEAGAAQRADADDVRHSEAVAAGDETAARVGVWPSDDPSGPSGNALALRRKPGGEPTPRRRDRYVVRRSERPAIDIEGGVRWERLTPGTLDDVEFMELIYAPGAESNPALYRHPGFEMVLVLTGRLVIYVGFDRYELEPGDSMAFSSTLPHRYLNEGEEPTRAITTILRDGLSMASR